MAAAVSTEVINRSQRKHWDLQEEENPTSSSSSCCWKVVCVTCATTPFARLLALELLSKGYAVRLAVPSQGEWETCMEAFERHLQSQRVSVVVLDLVVDTVISLVDAFQGCHGVFHTSSFVDPHSISGYREALVGMEEMVSRKVVEACSRAPSVRNCVFTSSLAACVWIPNSETLTRIDESCWSSEDICKEKKLWMALSKVKAEKAAWDVLQDLRDLHMATVCTAICTGIASPHVSYLKGAAEMYRSGTLATVSAKTAVTAHVSLYEEMCRGGANGRYLCFDKVIRSFHDLKELETDLHFSLGISDDDELSPSNSSAPLSNIKIKGVMAKSSACVWQRCSLYATCL